MLPNNDFGPLVTKRVKITADHIARGVRVEADACPLARAINAMLAPDHTISVWNCYDIRRNHVVIYSNQKADAVPPEAYQFARDFDARRDVTPMEFDFTLPAFFWKEDPK